jgi:Tol biopolymer transport system component
MTAANQINRYLALAIAASLAVAALPQAATHTASSSQKKPASFWEWVLRFTGVSATPSTLKGADDQVTSGQVWLADLRDHTRRKITGDGGYRSPVFLPDSTDILAVKAEDVVRLSLNSSTPQTVAKVSGITKLIGFDRDNAWQVLLLAEDDAGHAKVELFNLKSGQATQLSYDPQSSADHQMLEDLEGWERSYPAGTAYVMRETVQAMSGPVERSNVFWKQPGLDPVNVSQCQLTDCGQPSASSDGSKLVFIKALE